MRTLVSFLICLMPVLASAHVGEPYHIFELRDSELPDLRDGTLADWHRVFSLPTLTEHDFGSLNVGDAAPIGGRDLSTNIYLAWSGTHNRIYAAIERFDDAYINAVAEDTTRLWQNDGVEFLIDGDHSGGPYNIRDPNCKPAGTLGTQDLGPCNPPPLTAQQYVGVVAGQGEALLRLNNPRARWLRHPDSDAGGFVQPGFSHRSVIELFVTPLDTLSLIDGSSVPSRLQAGRTIGLQISLPDFDVGPGAYHGFSTLGGRPNTWRDADQFVDLVLVGVEDRPVPSSPTYAVDIDDLVLLDQDRNGILDVGETMEVTFLPPSRRQLTNESVRVHSDHPSFVLLDSSAQLLPAFSLSHTQIGTIDIPVHVEITDGDGQTQRRTVNVPTRSQRLAVDHLEILDAPPDGLGNGDGVADPGESIVARLVVQSESDVSDMRLFLNSASDDLVQYGDSTLAFETQDGRLQSSEQPRFLVSSAVDNGDSLRLRLSARTLFSTWAETLTVVVGPGVDAVPPALLSGPQVAYSDRGLTVALPDEAVIDGSGVAVVATVLDAMGAELAQISMTRVPGLQISTWRTPPGQYSVVLDVTDDAGNTTRSPVASFEASLPDSGDLVTILGGGEGHGAGVGTHLALGSPHGIAIDGMDRLVVVDALWSRILRRHPSGIVEIVGGQRGVRGFSGDGGPAREALFNHPHDVVVDGAGNLLVADTQNHRVRRIDVNGIVTTIAGTGQAGFSGDGGPARAAQLNSPLSLALNDKRQLFVADEGSNRVRRIDPDGTIHTVAGGGSDFPIQTDRPALETHLEGPRGVAIDQEGNLFIIERRDRVRRVSPEGRLLTMTTQSRDDPRSVIVGHDERIYIAFSSGRQVVRFPTDGEIRRIAPPIDRSLFAVEGEKLLLDGAHDIIRRPTGVALDRSGNLYISDASSRRVFVLHGATHEAPTGTAVTDRARLPNRLSLGIAPNPFNASVNITYSVPVPGQVRLEVYDLLGQKVRTLVDDIRPNGSHVVRWDGRLHNGRDVASGVYIALLSTDDQVRKQKLLLLR